MNRMFRGLHLVTEGFVASLLLGACTPRPPLAPAPERGVLTILGAASDTRTPVRVSIYPSISEGIAPAMLRPTASAALRCRSGEMCP